MRGSRPSSSGRGYNSRWQRAREGWLRSHPLCVKCLARSLVTEASVVDHIVPHKGDSALFWNRENWQSLCKRCHDSDKQREERGLAVLGCDVDGTPVDPGHHWNK